MKKLQPIDSLTEQDKYNIRKYIKRFANVECGPFEIVLKEWNNSKRKLYHALGNQLQIKKQLVLEKNTITLKERLKDIYLFFQVCYEYDLTFFRKEILSSQTTNFYYDFSLFVIDHPKLSFKDKKNILKMFEYDNIINGYFNNSFSLEEISFSVRVGAKTIRTFQKCIKALGYKNIKLFNEWKKQINLINSNCLNKVNLVISINPIDFMTMSDNACNWSSCMSWIKNGCYNSGTIEMMNSNIVAVAYVEAINNFSITLDENNIIKIPNKSWRTLVYCHKNIIMAGKSYPYKNDDLSKEVIKFMKETVEKSFGWKYQYGPQLYKDISNFHGNYFLKYVCEPTYNNKKKIVFHTDGMYNDIIEDTDCNYWCYRNKTSGLKLNLSGKNTCICCGKVKFETNDNYSPEDIRNKKICFECSSNRRCPICDTVSYYSDNEYNLCSEDCKKDAIIFPGQKRVINKVEFLSKKEKQIIIVAKDLDTYWEILKEVDTIKTAFNERKFIEQVEKKMFDKNIKKGYDYIIRVIPKIFIKENIVWLSTLIGSKFFIQNTKENRFFNVQIYRYLRKTGNRFSAENKEPILQIDETVKDILDTLNSLKYYSYNDFFKEGGINEISDSLVS